MRYCLLAAIAVVFGVLTLTATPGDELLAAYSTTLTGRMDSQRHNARLSLQHLDGQVIPPGGEFSFNEVVGGWSRDRGYRKAPVSYNGQLVSSWGGGVCQTSSTLYNAALLAGLKILERRRHHFAPNYVPPGRDAAVAYGSVDLRVRNPYMFPIRVKGEMSGDILSVRLYGRDRPYPKPQIVGEVHAEHQPVGMRVGQPGPYTKVRNSGKTGYNVTVWRVINGRKELISQDHYPPMNRLTEYRQAVSRSR